MSVTAPHWIDGEPAGRPTTDNIDPATGERIGRFRRRPRGNRSSRRIGPPCF